MKRQSPLFWSLAGVLVVTLAWDAYYKHWVALVLLIIGYAAGYLMRKVPGHPQA